MCACRIRHAASSFATAPTAATESVIAEQGLVRKVFFPREVLPLAAVGAGLVDLLPSLLLGS